MGGGGVGGGGDCYSLKASTVSGDVVLTAVELVIHGKKHNSDGALCLLLSPRTLLLEWGSVHPPMSLTLETWGEIHIKNVVAIH